MNEIYKGLISSSVAAALLAWMITWILKKLIPTLEALDKHVCDSLRKMQEAEDRASMVELLKLAANAELSAEVRQRASAIAEKITKEHQ